MEEKLKFRPSTLLILSRVVLVVCIIGFCIFTIFGVVDVKSEEQKHEERSEQVTNNDLFDDAATVLKQYRNDFHRTKIRKISCVSARSSNIIVKAVLITESDGNEVCYVFNRTLKSWMFSVDNSYEYYSNQLRVISKLVLSGDDLSILYEEVND